MIPGQHSAYGRGRLAMGIRQPGMHRSKARLWCQIRQTPAGRRTSADSAAWLTTSRKDHAQVSAVPPPLPRNAQYRTRNPSRADRRSHDASGSPYFQAASSAPAVLSKRHQQDCEQGDQFHSRPTPDSGWRTPARRSEQKPGGCNCSKTTTTAAFDGSPDACNRRRRLRPACRQR